MRRLKNNTYLQKYEWLETYLLDVWAEIKSKELLRHKLPSRLIQKNWYLSPMVPPYLSTFPTEDPTITRATCEKLRDVAWKALLRKEVYSILYNLLRSCDKLFGKSPRSAQANLLLILITVYENIVILVM